MGSTGFLLGIISTLLEYFTIGFLKVHRRMAAHHLWYAAIISMAFSYGVGRAFAAGGLITMMGGMISTLLSMGMYLGLEWWSLNKERTRKSWDQNMELFRDLWKGTRAFLRMITWPIRKWREIKAWWAMQKARYNKVKLRWSR